MRQRLLQALIIILALLALVYEVKHAPHYPPGTADLDGGPRT